MAVESSDMFGLYFTLMKMKYQAYDEILTDLDYLKPTDKINLFINLETVLNYISMIQDLEKKMLTCPDLEKLLVSNILNLAAHYKEFFRGNGLDTNIFIYMTDLSSTPYDFRESQYNEDFRSYYLNKYMSNPKFVLLGTKLNEVIIPEVKTICEYIPQVYFLSKKGIDSGIIPAIISKKYSDRKNIILSGDLHDTQYYYEENFMSHLYKRGYGFNIFASTVKQYLEAITKMNDIPDEVIELFKNGSFYKLLLSVIGEKYRSIDDITGIKMGKLLSYIMTGLKDARITKTTSSASMLADIFPDEFRKSVFTNMMVLDIHNEMSLLGEGESSLFDSMLIDKVDTQSLTKLNQDVFYKCPLRIESLLK